jgi:hypothetical protein
VTLVAISTPDYEKKKKLLLFHHLYVDASTLIILLISFSAFETRFCCFVYFSQLIQKRKGI